ncbi:hypothetical protein TH44_17330 [Thalassospira xiamenensis]|uniref:Uncharacterized protein n=1 Tax=Thalassospira xiamenensis TaxID=220697 RepID=A0A367X177_9PROT|nr:hypothetical protein TH44_17330 [Thalassospira xiamenensis]
MKNANGFVSGPEDGHCGLLLLKGSLSNQRADAPIGSANFSICWNDAKTKTAPAWGAVGDLYGAGLTVR